MSVALVGVLLAATGVAAMPKAGAGSAPTLPSTSSFYRYTGSKPLAAIKPGTILKKRSISVKLAGVSLPFTAEQLLYRTTDELRHPSVTVTTIIKSPTDVTGGLIGYLSFYDALGSECDPSYTLAGGYAGTSSNEQQADEEEALISHYLALGWTVTVPDFEGTHLHWGAGQESGYATLDAIRATETWLGDKPAKTRVALSGYSGGSIAADWAAELAPRYAPSIDLAGVAMGGIPVDFAHNLRYVNGSQDWSGVIPAVIVSLGRAFHVSLRKYESAYGKKLAKQVSHECIGSFLGSYPGLTVQKLLKHRYRHVLQIPAFRRIVNHLIMGRAPGHPRAPLFMGVGDVDGRGDGVMVRRDVEALAHEYCKQGVSVHFTTFWKQDHVSAGLSFEVPADTDLLRWMNGESVPSNCATIGKGSSLAPVRAHQRRS